MCFSWGSHGHGVAWTVEAMPSGPWGRRRTPRWRDIPAHAVTLAQAAVAATREVPGVADISRGRYAIARTFGLGGRVVEGIQLRQVR
jgi:hypothetical protein